MGADLQARWHRSIAEIPQSAWQAIVAPHDLPHFSWDWLHCLEISGAIAPCHGWQSCHLSLWRHKELIAVAPLYLKAHSYGEFVFDQAFAQVAGQLGLEYYPKLLGMSPLTPAMGYRFFMALGEDQQSMTQLMFKLVDDLCRRNGILSANFLYAAADWAALAEQAGCATWLQLRSEWRRTGEHRFSDYLASFNANQRRNIKRERRAVAQAGISLMPMAGEEIPPGMLQQMHGFYAAHCARWGPWGSKYLTEDFFRLAEQRLRRHLVLFSAHEKDPLAPVAMSLCLRNGRQLWGRYWGSDVEVSGLHFETCYYTPITWALEQGIQQFDPGAGGSHKQRRGFRAEPFACLHRWFDPTLDQLLRAWLPPTNRRLIEQINILNAQMPLHSPSSG